MGPVAGLLMLLLGGLLIGGGCRANLLEESPLQRRMASQNGAHGSPKAPEKRSRAAEFNETGVLQPEYQIRATLKPNNVSQFLYLSPKTGPAPTLLVSPCSGPIFWSVSYLGSPETDQHAEGTKSAQTHYLVKNMIPGRPLFTYKGADTRSYTIPVAQANLYQIEMRPESSPFLHTRAPNTVLLYATSDALAHLPGNLAGPAKTRAQLPRLEFQQRWSRRRLIVSWNKSYANPDKSSYLLAVTSGAKLHPPTLCAAENILKKHPCLSRPSSGQQLAQQRSEPEGLHCVRRTKLTLFGVKYNTTYYFTLYIMNTHTNVSSLVAKDSFRFHRKPPKILESGRYATTNLRENKGLAVFRYRPRDNTTTIFHILACGACSIKAKFRGFGGYHREEQIGGEFLLRAPALPPGGRFSIQLSVSPSSLDLVKMSRVKILAKEDTSFTNNSASWNSLPWEYRTLRKCQKRRVSRCSSSSSAGRRGDSSVLNSGSGDSGGGGGGGGGGYENDNDSGSTSRPCGNRRSPAHSLARPCPSP